MRLKKEEQKRGKGSLGYLNPDISRTACAEGKSSFRSNQRISRLMQGTTFQIVNSDEKPIKVDAGTTEFLQQSNTINGVEARQKIGGFTRPMQTQLSSATTASTARGASSSKTVTRTAATTKSALTDDDRTKVETSQFSLGPEKPVISPHSGRHLKLGAKRRSNINIGKFLFVRI